MLSEVWQHNFLSGNEGRSKNATRKKSGSHYNCRQINEIKSFKQKTDS
jgi:hypothetical protein